MVSNSVFSSIEEDEDGSILKNLELPTSYKILNKIKQYFTK